MKFKLILTLIVSTFSLSVFASGITCSEFNKIYQNTSTQLEDLMFCYDSSFSDRRKIRSCWLQGSQNLSGFQILMIENNFSCKNGDALKDMSILSNSLIKEFEVELDTAQKKYKSM